MKKLGFYIISFLAVMSSVLFQSCSKNYCATPISASSNANLLSAYATIGSSSYFDGPTGIQYFNNHLWVANWSTFLQKWATIGAAPVTTIWTYNSGVSFTEVNGDGIDPVTGNVYVCDEYNNQIAVFNQAGDFLAVFGSAQMSVSGPTIPYGSIPMGVAVNSSGTTVYALGLYSNSVYVYSVGGTASSPTYNFQYNFGSTGSGATTLNYPYNLRIDNGGNVWVADQLNHRLAKYSGSGTYLNSFQVTGIDANFSPVDVLVDGQGDVYGLDSDAGVVVKFNSYGIVLGQFGKGILSSPGGITTDGSGNFFVTSRNPQEIVAFH